MIYSEMLRVRKTLYWWGAALGAWLLILVASAWAFGHGHLHIIVSGQPHELVLPITALIVLAMLFTTILASSLAPSLNHLRPNVDFVLTKPISRERLVLGYFAVDAVALVIGFVLIFVIGALLPALFVGFHIVGDRDALNAIVLGFGTAIFWYALVQLITADLRINGGVIAGFSWLVFSLVLLLSSYSAVMPAALAFVVKVLMYLDPLAYFMSVQEDSSHGQVINTFSRLGPSGNLIAVWTLAAVATGLTVVRWKRLQI